MSPHLFLAYVFVYDLFLSPEKKGDFFMKKTKLGSNALIWFGAGVSIAEILTGISVAPLGFAKGISAIVTGHVIGCILMFLAGIIGGKTRLCAMDTVKISYGKKGSLLFSSLNVIQLVGWTSIMIVSGASAAQAAYPMGQWIWSIIVGVLVVIWLFAETEKLDILNTIAVTALFIMTIILSFVIFKGNAVLPKGNISFGTAVELSVAMPLSWLPLISDYTSKAEKPVAASFVSTVVYFFVSCWMYIIGMGAAIFTNESNVALILVKSGLGLTAILIVILSTVTTTYLDVFSAGESAKSMFSGINRKYAALAVSVIGTIMAIVFKVFEFEPFLYFIGSVFAPMISIQIVDFFIFKKHTSTKNFEITSLVIWLLGFTIYRIFMKTDMVVGCTLPAMALTGFIYFAIRKIIQAGR